MNTIVILSISMLLQLMAILLAIRLIRITGRCASWILIVLALILMEVRRGLPLFQMLFGNIPHFLATLTELVSLATSALLVVGVGLIAPLFQAIKRSEESLQESREWLSTTLTSIGDAVITTDTEGLITFMNPVAQSLTGWSQEEAEGVSLKKVFTIVDERTGEPREDPASRVIRKNKVDSLDHDTLLIAKDGARIPIDDSAAPIKNNQGEIIGTVLVFRDISSRKRAEEEVRRAHEELDQIFNTAAGGMRVIDRDFNIIQVNETFSTITGVSKEKAIGEKCYQVFHGPVCHTPHCCLTRILSGEKRIEEDIEKVRNDGQKVFCLVVATPFRGPDGQVIGIVESFQNIDERKRMEELLRLAKMVIENSPTVLFRWRAQKGWPVEFVTENVSRLGYQPQELLDGKILYASIVHPEDLDRVRQEIREQSALGNRHFQQEYRIVTKDGAVRWVDARTLAEYGPDGQICHYQGIIIDITERRQAEEALKFKKEQERLSAILDGNPIPAFVIDPEHRVVLWNRACESLTGVSKEQALGKPVDSAIFYQGQIRPVLADLVLDMDSKAMSRLYADKNLSPNTAIPEAFEAKDLLIINGVARNVYFLAARLRDSSGKIIGAIETIQDITEWEQLQKQFLHAQKMEAIGRLAGGVAHDFNNLLVIIRGYSEFLLSRLQEGAPLYREIDMIRKAGERAVSLTRQLLAFSRKQILQPKVLDLNALISDMEKMLHRLIGEDIALEVILDPNLERIKADPGQIEQVIMNLVVNARDAMPEGGKLTIRTDNMTHKMIVDHEPGHAEAKEGGFGRFACLSISDTGVGIDQQIIDQIFEPFFTTKEPGKGTGLGLSTVYGIVKQHEGFLRVESAPGQGSTFRIYLPALTLTRSDNETLTAVSLPKAQGKGERVLVVEDDSQVRAFASAMLRENGYLTFEAATVAEAIDIFEREQENIHLIFTDVTLPDKNGLELVDYLLSRHSRLKVLLCSGYTDERSQWPTIREGKLRFLKKPYTLSDMLQAVNEALQADPPSCTHIHTTPSNNTAA